MIIEFAIIGAVVITAFLGGLALGTILTTRSVERNLFLAPDKESGDGK